MDDAQAAFEGIFENMVKQMHVLNTGVELNTSGMGVNYYMAAGKIQVPNYLKEFVAQPTGVLPNYRPSSRKGSKGDC